MLNELIDRYGQDAVVTARPHMLDSGETYRWELAIDGDNVPEADVHMRRHPERRDVMVLLLVRGAEAVELDHWSTKTKPYGPAGVMCRLGDLR
jgi:hypothetical protein